MHHERGNPRCSIGRVIRPEQLSSVPGQLLREAATTPSPPPLNLPSTPNMICRRCLRLRALPLSHSSPRATRPLSTTTTLNATPISANTATQTAPRQGTPGSSHNPPAATSTSAAQPFSDKTTPAASPALKKDAAAAAEKKATPLVRSSCVAGTPLKGLNFYKDKQDPVAMADEEYPEWLWTVLDRQEKKGEAAGQGDLFCTFLQQCLHSKFCLLVSILESGICILLAKTS